MGVLITVAVAMGSAIVAVITLAVRESGAALADIDQFEEDEPI
jgi:hypothetical protein